MGCYSKTAVSESELLRIARFVCDYSPGNILLIGGGCVLSETAGYRRMRNLSDDLDFIANDEGLDAVRTPLNLGDYYRDGTVSEGGNVTYINDILVSFFHRDIRGWQIPAEVFKHPRVIGTSIGNVYAVPAELNLALKVRRGASKEANPHIYGKDTLDAASIFLGSLQKRESFNSATFVNHLLKGVCESCKLPAHGRCIQTLRRSEKQLVGQDRQHYEEFMNGCASMIESACTKAFA